MQHMRDTNHAHKTVAALAGSPLHTLISPLIQHSPSAGLQAAFASIAGAGAATPGVGGAVAAAGPSSSGGGGTASSGSGFSRPLGAAAGAANPKSGAVRDLGVVGRGQKRITLAPVPAAGGGGAAAAAGSAAAPKRRRLDDVMGACTIPPGSPQPRHLHMGSGYCCCVMPHTLCHHLYHVVPPPVPMCCTGLV